MPKVTIVFGLLLCGLTAVVLLIKQEFMGTWLIPSAVGLPLILLGLVAAKSAAYRMHVMHAAVTIALLGGLLALVRGVTSLVGWLFFQSKPMQPLAAGMIWAMTLLCFIFVGLCVQSFIAARKARENK
jgi:hypothetical protein